MTKRRSRKGKRAETYRQSPQTWDYSLLVGHKFLGHLIDIPNIPNNNQEKSLVLYLKNKKVDSRLQNYFRLDLKMAVSDWVILELEQIPRGKKTKKDLYPIRIKQNSIYPVSEVVKPENLSQEVWSHLKEWLGSSRDELFAYGERWFVLHERLDTLQDEIQRKWQEELDEQSRPKDSEVEKGKFIPTPEELPPQKEELEHSPAQSIAKPQPAPFAVPLEDEGKKRTFEEEEHIRLEEQRAIFKREQEEFRRTREEFEEQKRQTIARLSSQQASLAQQQSELEHKQKELEDQRLFLEKEQAKAQEELKRQQEEFAQRQSAQQTSLRQDQEELERKQKAVKDERLRLQEEQTNQHKAQEELKRQQGEFVQRQSAQQTSLRQQQKELEGKQQLVEDERLRLQEELANQQKAQEDLKHQTDEVLHALFNQKKSLVKERDQLQRQQKEFAQWESSERARLELLQARLNVTQEKLRDKERELEEEGMLLDVDKLKIADAQKEIKEKISQFEEEQRDELEHLEEQKAKANREQDQLALWAQSLQQKEAELGKRFHQLKQQLRRWGLSDPDMQEETTPEELADFKNEDELLTHIQRYVQSQAFDFSPLALANFYTCLKTGALVILAGLSGTGKSSLVRLFAEAIDAAFLPLSVKATWRDDADLLGFYHPEKKYYIPTPFLDFLVEAETNPERLFIICLDEMNLSRVESYFSEFLSVLEQNEKHRKLRLYSKYESDSRWREVKKVKNKEAENSLLDEQEHNLTRYPAEIMIPPNLFFCGTVNVDETTYPFSDKVLDRAQIIQLTDVSFSEASRLQVPSPPKKRLSFQMFQEYCHLDPKIALPINAQWFDELNQILRRGGFHFGYRVKRQIETYCTVAKASQLLPLQIAVDLQMTQKILPKIQGIKTPRVKNMLFALRAFCSKYQYSQATDQIIRLEQMDPLNYWDVFRYVD